MANVEEPIGHRSSAWCGYAFDAPDDLIDFRRHLWQLDLSGDHREKLREVKGRHHWANWQWRELDDYCVARSIPYWEHIRPTHDYVYNWSSQSLRFEDGDVLVKLSPDPEDWLLLHSHVLGSVSPIMHAAFKDEWSRNTVNVVHPITKREYQLYVLCPQYDPTIGALFLQPEVRSRLHGLLSATMLNWLNRTPHSRQLKWIGALESPVWRSFAARKMRCSRRPKKTMTMTAAASQTELEASPISRCSSL